MVQSRIQSPAFPSGRSEVVGSPLQHPWNLLELHYTYILIIEVGGCTSSCNATMVTGLEGVIETMVAGLEGVNVCSERVMAGLEGVNVCNETMVADYRGLMYAMRQWWPD